MAYLKQRALHRLSVLSNSKVRQPLRTFAPGAWVYIWRRRPWIGYNRPHWFGPGRVVFTERLPRGRAIDDRGHIVWILLGSRLVRCSTYSVRPATDREEEFLRLKFPAVVSERPEDIVPRGQYEDWSGDIPGELEMEVDFAEQTACTWTKAERLDIRAWLDTRAVCGCSGGRR